MRRFVVLQMFFLFVAFQAMGQGKLGFIGYDLSVLKKYWKATGYEDVYLGTNQGIYVGFLRYNGAAQMAGIVPYDVITAIDNVPTPTFDKMKAYLFKKRAGNVVSVTVFRYYDKKKYTFKVVLENSGSNDDYYVDGDGYYYTLAQVDEYLTKMDNVIAQYYNDPDPTPTPTPTPSPKPDPDPAPAPAPQPVMAVSDVDKNIPKGKQTNNMTYAVIIGNEKYEHVASVPFAENDAKVFREYVIKTLCVPENHIRYITNGGLNSIHMAIKWLKDAMDANGGNAKVLFYYAGHGIPDEASKTAYLLPTDGDGSMVESAYPLSKLYSELGQSSAQSVTIFLDACFSGSKREGDMIMAARGVAIKVKPSAPEGKMVVFTAAKDDQTAYPYKKEQHGMFTYYLLKKLKKTKGETTLGELGDYLQQEVGRQSFDENQKTQNPTVSASASLGNTWRSMKLR